MSTIRVPTLTEDVRRLVECAKAGDAAEPVAAAIVDALRQHLELPETMSAGRYALLNAPPYGKHHDEPARLAHWVAAVTAMLRVSEGKLPDAF